MTEDQSSDPAIYVGVLGNRRIALLRLPTSVSVSTSGGAAVTPLGGGGRASRAKTQTYEWKVWDISRTEVTAGTLTAAVDQLSSITGKPVSEIVGSLQPMLPPPSGVVTQFDSSHSAVSGTVVQLAGAVPRCYRCGASLPTGSIFCNKCGEAVRS